ncbi:MAG TPA: PAS domain S-box protein, partial [Burkholderiaceae bacterium]
MDNERDTPEHVDSGPPDGDEQPGDLASARDARTPPVVGLGGSAGSIQALQAFFASVPPATGLAYVVVLHLSGEHESTLAELLQRSTPMRVLQVHESHRFEPDTVYVIPPRKALRSLDGYLQVSDLPRGRYPHIAVDLFFRTLADTHGPHAAAIVLSGVDGDGAIGIKRVKERGGLTIAQDPDEAQYGGMPRAAVGTGMVDWVLPVEQMAERVLTYFRLEDQIKLPPEQGPQPTQVTPPAGGAAEAALRDVLTFLRTRTGRDFSYYKRATILRRIGRRMQVNAVEDLHGYLGCLRTRPGEAGALLQDLLISVTNFFRDPNCFAALEASLPRLFQNKTGVDSLRVWVAACATGEEAYSIAMMLSEHARTLESPPHIQIFATDLDEDAIRTAREGIYPTTIEADVSEERLRRFFVKEHRGYRVRRELREMVLFAVHDVLKDSPFSRQELVACRNLLIYLNREAQSRALDTFHFALVPGGQLFLGSSESVEDGSPLFSVLDKKHRLYVHRSTPRIGLPVPPGPGTLAIAMEAQQSARSSPIVVAGPAFAHATATLRPGAALDGRAGSWSELHFKLLEHLAPPSLLVDTEHDIVHLSPSAGRFLQYGGGEPSRNLVRAIHPGLRIELRAALYQATQAEGPIEVPPVPVDLNGSPMSVAMTVTPLADIAPGLSLVTLRAAVTPGELVRGGEAGDAQVEPVPLAHHLDRELERLKAHLRDTVEQYEASTEELKASNEELQAMNEELRSATEELETSREELQSINEELTTVNHELKNKVDELGHSNSDMQNLMDATAIATVFLDREMRITRYTPSAVALFNLIPTDVGRPLTDLTSQLDYPDLGDDAQRVLDRLVPVEREVSEGDGSWYLVRALPYRTLDDRIAGVVLTFVDITERKRGQEALRHSEERFSAIVNQAAVGVVQVSLDGRITFGNQYQQELLGYSDGELVETQLLDIVHPADRPATERLLERLMQQNESFQTENRWVRKDGSVIWLHSSGSSLFEMGGQPNSILVVSTDITERKRAEDALRRSEAHLRLIIENAVEYAIFATDRDRRITTWSAGAARLLGYAEDEVLGQRYDIIFTDEDRAAGVPQLEAGRAEREGIASDDRFHLRKNGGRFWASGVLSPMQDAAGAVVGFVKVLRDQTDMRTAQEALERSRSELIAALNEEQRIAAALESADAQKDRFLAVLSHELRNPLAAISSASQAMQLGVLKAKERTRAAEIVLRQSNVMRLLLDDLLDVSRLRLGKLTLNLRPV